MADYSPEQGPVPDGVFLTHGVIRSTYNEKAITVSEAVMRRVDPHRQGRPTCHRHEVLLPPTASDMLLDVHALVARYEQQLMPDQQDILGVTTVRFPEPIPAHAQYELARGWARAALVADALAVVLVQHLPAHAGRAHLPHCHALYPARLLQGCSHFGLFTDLIQPGAKRRLAASWGDWLAVNA